jgi:flagellar basal-body rod protein FlgF
MIKGLYTAASAMLAGLTRQKLISHNLANVDTPGFRQILTSLDDWKNTSVNTIPGVTFSTDPQRYLGQLGLGTDTIPEVTDFSEGALRQTGYPLDVAIQGNGFFHIRTPNGDRYTRDGRFQRDVAGNMVTAEGYAVLNNAGNPISLPAGPVTIDRQGQVFANNQPLTQLGIGAFANPQTDLARDPDTGDAFAAVGAAAGGPTGTFTGTTEQGYVENSNVNSAQMMTQMVTVNRAYEAAQRMVQAQDSLLGEAITQVGRLS